MLGSSVAATLLHAFYELLRLVRPMSRKERVECVTEILGYPLTYCI